jgi:hypothetical protein
LRRLTERERGTRYELSIRRETATARHARHRVEETHSWPRVDGRRITVSVISACGGKQPSREDRQYQNLLHVPTCDK